MKDLLYYLDTAPIDISAQFETLHFKKGESILWEGIENSAVYLLLGGNAQGYLQGIAGDITPVFHYHAPSLFGEFEVFCDSENIITISALTPCTVKRLAKRAFLSWMESDFDFTQYVASQLVKKITENSILFDTFKRRTVKQRVLRVVALWHANGSLDALTKQILAVEASAPMRSVNRAIAACEKSGVFGYGKKHFFVLDEKRLLTALPD